jgi:hypothetical protein
VNDIELLPINGRLNIDPPSTFLNQARLGYQKRVNMPEIGMIRLQGKKLS